MKNQMKWLKRAAIDSEGRIGNDAAFPCAMFCKDRVGRRSLDGTLIGKIGTSTATLGKWRLAP